MAYTATFRPFAFAFDNHSHHFSTRSNLYWGLVCTMRALIITASAHVVSVESILYIRPLSDEYAEARRRSSPSPSAALSRRSFWESSRHCIIHEFR